MTPLVGWAIVWVLGLWLSLVTVMVPVLFRTIFVPPVYSSVALFCSSALEGGGESVGAPVIHEPTKLGVAVPPHDAEVRHGCSSGVLPAAATTSMLSELVRPNVDVPHSESPSLVCRGPLTASAFRNAISAHVLLGTAVQLPVSPRVPYGYQR